MQLSAEEHADLAGDNGFPVQWAMDVLVTAAKVFDAPALVPISQAHLVGAYFSGAANIALLDKLLSQGAKVRVPTTLNASSADLSPSAPRCYAAKEAPEAQAVVGRLVKMGCRASLTCAPYFLPSRPKMGEIVAWAESNAVLYANSVLGARSLKSPQFFDLACALTGKTIKTGAICDAGRRPQIHVDASAVSRHWFEDELGHQLVGFAVGEIAAERVPLITGLPPRNRRSAHLDMSAMQGLCASAGVSGAMALLHADGLTPEAHLHKADQKQLERYDLRDETLDQIRGRWPARTGAKVGAMCLGAPHLGAEQVLALNEIVAAARTPLTIPAYISLSRAIAADPAVDAALEQLKAKGVRIVHDTCTYYGSLLGDVDGVVATNSLKWAAYGRANLGVQPALMAMPQCVAAAITGHVPAHPVYGDRHGLD